MSNKNRIKNSALVVGSALIGAFTSRYLDNVLSWPSPWDVIGGLISIIFVFLVVYFGLGKFLD